MVSSATSVLVFPVPGGPCQSVTVEVSAEETAARCDAFSPETPGPPEARSLLAASCQASLRAQLGSSSALERDSGSPRRTERTRSSPAVNGDELGGDAGSIPSSNFAETAAGSAPGAEGACTPRTAEAPSLCCCRRCFSRHRRALRSTSASVIPSTLATPSLSRSRCFSSGVTR